MSDETPELEELLAGLDPVTSKRTVDAAFEELQRRATNEAQERHKAAQVEFRDKVAELRATGKATPAALEALRSEALAAGMNDVTGRQAFSTEHIAGALQAARQRVEADTLTEQYREAMLANRGDKKRLEAIKRNFEARGLDVEHTSIFGGR